MVGAWWVDEGQLNDEQKRIIALPLDGSHLIFGPPGSGKTNLVLLRANYLTLAGHPNILIVVFTRTLQEFITTGAQQYNFSMSKLTTSTRWAFDFLTEYGVRVSPPDTFEAQRTYLAQAVTALLEKRKLEDGYDAVLLDEAQDYLPEEIAVFRRLGKRLFAVADSHQKIYGGLSPLDTLRSVIPNHHTLKYHYRNGVAICRVADSIAADSSTYVPMTPTSNYDEKAKPSRVDVFRCRDRQHQASAIIEQLDLQLKAYPDELLGVVCPTNDALDDLWAHIAASPLASRAVLQRFGDYAPFGPSHQIAVSTIHSAKGLEFRCLHLADAELIRTFPQQRRNIAYTAVTRAKTSLSLYHCGEMPGFLQSALGVIDPVTKLPSLPEVFGRNQ